MVMCSYVVIFVGLHLDCVNKGWQFFFLRLNFDVESVTDSKLRKFYFFTNSDMSLAIQGLFKDYIHLVR